MLDSIGQLKRTHYAGELRAEHAGGDVVLMGWVHRRRDLGQLIFIDVRDRAGIAQVVFNKESAPEAHAKAEQLRSEYVVAIEGRVTRRAKPNPELATGEVEVMASKLHLLNTAKTPPFQIEDEITATEETRLRYRYLDLRRAKPHANLALRHRVILEIRKAMDELGFYEVETPMLTRATPEGARDYLVPSRVHPGNFYALPQSPQIFKQILMISGLDRYFQIARCFRDEDLRADRQPDFTQLDLEMSFPTRDDVFAVVEVVCQRAWKVIGVDLRVPFPRMPYREAVRRFGTDKPDFRFGMELADVTVLFESGREKLGFAGSVYGFAAPGAAGWSRKQVDELAEKAKSLDAKGCYTAKVGADGGAQSALAKTLGDDAVKKLCAATGGKAGDLVVAVAAKEKIPGTEAAALIAGQLRLYMADKLGLVAKSSPFDATREKWDFVFLTDFPAFEWSTREKRWVPAQHPFTGIFEEDLDLLEQPERHGEIRSKGYDLVLNGVELASGSIRIHQQDVQARVFRALGLSDEEARRRFGFFLDALAYGTPPHGGIAPGIDRMVMLMAGETSLREVIAFPKTAKAQDLMAEAPSPVEPSQLEELGISIRDYRREMSREAIRIDATPTDFLGDPIPVSADVLRKCAEEGRFSPVAFDLFKETATVVAACSHAYAAYTPGEIRLERNQAICAGLLVRIAKLMTATLQLVAGSRRGEVVKVLNRLIFESVCNLRFLVLKNQNEFFDDFVRSSLGPERELFDLIQDNIRKRYPQEVLPIEERMLKSIERVCRLGSVEIEEIDPRFKNWGGGLRERLKAVGDESLYLAVQRIPSHAVHGSWVDLIVHHIKEANGGFVPDSDWSDVDPRYLCPPSILVLDGVKDYLDRFFAKIPDIVPILDRINDLQRRIRELDEAHEKWLAESDKT